MRASAWLPVVGALALLAWIAWGPGRGGGCAIAVPDPGAPAMPQAAPGDQELAELDPAELELAAADAEPRRGLQAAAAPEGSEPPQVVRGRVVTPPGAPHDETLVVRAFDAEPRDLESLVTIERPSIAGLGSAIVQRTPTSLAVAPVGVAGAFSLELPAEVESVWLQVDGRFLALPEPVPLRLPAAGEPVLRPRLGAWIHGVARGAAEGQPVLAGWDVAGSLPGDADRSPPMGFALADADGGFELRALPSPGTWWVGTRAESSAVALYRGLNVAPGGALELELESAPGAVVSGRVAFAAEDPAGADADAPDDGVPGVTVSAFAAAHAELNGSSWLVPVALTDADGAFALTGVALGPTRIVAREGFCSAETLELDVSAGVQGLRIELDMGATLTGRVLLPDGAPAPDVTVRAVQRRLSTRSDAAGRFRFGCLDSRRDVQVEARLWRDDGAMLLAKGTFAVGEDVQLVLGPRPAPAKRDGEVDPEPRVAGVVRAPDGSPVAGAEVRFVEVGQTDGPPQPWLEGSTAAKTDALGRFEVPARRAAEADLVARGEGFAPSAPVRVPTAAVAAAVESASVGSGSPRTDPHGRGSDVARDPAVELVLRLGGGLHGGVYADGVAQSRFTVTALHRDGGDWRVASTDAEGAYRFDALLPGGYVLIAKPLLPAGASYEELLELQRRGELRASADVVAGEDVSVHLGTLPAHSVRVFGRVTAGGQPRQALVVFVPDGGSPFADARRCLADERGEYEVDLGPGSHRRFAMTGGRSAMSARLDVIEIPRVAEHRIDVELPSARIRGRVLTEESIEGTEVVAFRLDEGGGAPAFGIAETDAEGAFAIEGLAPGRYQVLADRGGRGIAFRPAQVDLAAGEDVQVELRGERSGKLRVTAVDGSGKRVPGARIVVLAGGLVLSARAETGADGSELVPHLVPGVCRVLVTAPDLAGEGSFEVISGAETAARIELAPAGMLRVEVLDGEGRLVRAAVAVTGEGTAPAIPDFDALLEGADPIELSATSIGPLPHGRYEVTATAADGRTATRSARITGPGERKLRIRLRD